MAYGILVDNIVKRWGSSPFTVGGEDAVELPSGVGPMWVYDPQADSYSPPA